MFQKPSSVQTYTHYYSGDPAFDKDHEDYAPDKFEETGDLKFLPRKPGGPEPTAFTLKPLSQKERFWIQVKSEEGSLMLLYWAVALAVQDVKPLLIDGEPHRVSRIKEGSVSRLCDFDMEILVSVDEGGLVGELAKRVLTEATGNPS